MRDPGDQTRRFRAAGVAPQRRACHLMRVGGYVVVGHMPLDVLERPRRERSAIRNMSLPGMPGPKSRRSSYVRLQTMSMCDSSPVTAGRASRVAFAARGVYV